VKTLNSAVAVIEISSPALGYRALDLFTQNSEFEVLEATAHGSKVFTLIARGEKSQLETVVRKISANIASTGSSSVRDSIVIDDIAPEIIETYFSLHTVEMAESLLVVECETLSGLFQSSAQALKNYKLKAIELRNLRGDNPTALGLFTGVDSDCVSAAESIKLSLEHAARNGTVEVINKPTASFRTFFNLST
jgi:hypothetical protein